MDNAFKMYMASGNRSSELSPLYNTEVFLYKTE